jgi:capsular polysaccharide biosynthesis protein
MFNKDNNELEIDVVKLLLALWRFAAVILLVGIVFSAAAFLYAQSFVPPRYEANALFYVNNSTVSLSSAVAITTGELSAASGLVSTYVAILQSRANMELVLQESGAPYTYEELRKMVSASAVNSTGLFRVTVTSSDPEEARTLANVIANILPDKISDIVNNSSVEVVDYAVTPHSRVSPSYLKYAMVGLLLGIVFAGAIVVLRDLQDDVIHDEDYLLSNFDAPVLASIPDLEAKGQKKYGYGYGYGYGAASREAKKGGKD